MDETQQCHFVMKPGLQMVQTLIKLPLGYYSVCPLLSVPFHRVICVNHILKKNAL